MKIAATLHDRVLAAAEAAGQHLDAEEAEIAVILGSGLASAADRLPDARGVPYAALPGFPEPTVAGHPGRLLCGRWGGKEISRVYKPPGLYTVSRLRSFFRHRYAYKPGLINAS